MYYKHEKWNHEFNRKQQVNIYLILEVENNFINLLLNK